MTPAQWIPYLNVIVLTGAVVVACVVLHYEALSWLTRLIKRIHLPPRSRILMLIFSIMFVHVIEIWIFALAYLGLLQDPRHGVLVAAHPIGLFDSVYFSAVCFTTLGLGDVVPVGAIRFMTGSQSLCGFVLIAWSGSFTFVEMQRFWKE
jgi:hypothetical protein